MDELGLLLLFSSFPCALLLIMLTDVAEQRQALAAAAGTQADARRRQPTPVAELGGQAAAQQLWDVRGFFGPREKTG